MLFVHTSHQLGHLFRDLTDVLNAPLPSARGPMSFLKDDWVGVQSLEMRTWLTAQLTREFGVFSATHMPLPATVVEALMRSVVPQVVQAPRFAGRRAMALEMFAQLPDWLGQPVFAPVQSFLQGDDDGSARMSLAVRMANLFDEYLLYRPQMLCRWQQQRDGQADWQAALWQHLIGDAPTTFAGDTLDAFAQRLQAEPGALPFARLCLFGITHLPPVFVRVLAMAAQHCDVHLFTVRPLANMRSARHPLVCTLGAGAADFQQVVEKSTQDMPRRDVPRFDVAAAPPGSSMLRHLQSDIWLDVTRGVSDAAPPIALAAPDGSIEVHNCRSSLREVEVLYQRLLDTLERDPTLQPGDIAVLAPNMADYAPYIDTVFGRPAAHLPRIPYRLCAPPPVDTAGVFAAFGAQLQLPDTRLTLSDLIDILAIHTIAERAGLRLEDVVATGELASSAQIRFGIDAAHRASLGLPAFADNTWQAGLDRMMLGFAMQGDGRHVFADTLPLDGLGGERERYFKTLAMLGDTLFTAVAQMRAPHTFAQWEELLQGLLSQLFGDGDASLPDVQLLRQALRSATEDAEAAQQTAPVSREAWRQALQMKWPNPSGRTYYGGGGVTFCALLPQRNIPFRVVALLGMNSGSFPGARTPSSFDKMEETPLSGDRNPRSDDRLLFLESLLAAQDKVLIFYVGGTVHDTAPLPPSPVLYELLDVLDDSIALPDGATVAASATLAQPLKPWSPQCFQAAHPQLASYDTQMCQAAQALLDGAHHSAKPFLAALPKTPSPDVDDAVLEVSLSELEDFFRAPLVYFLRRRLQLGFVAPEDALPRDLPGKLGSLDRYGAGTQLFDEYLKTGDAQNLYPALRASGVRPPGVARELALRDLDGEVAQLVEAVRHSALRPSETHKTVLLPLTVGEHRVQLFGRVAWPDAAEGRLEARFVRVHGCFRLRACLLHLLVLCHTGDAALQTTLIGRTAKGKGAETCVLGAPKNPAGILSDLVAIYLRGRAQPLPIDMGHSWAYAQKPEKGFSPEALLGGHSSSQPSRELPTEALLKQWLYEVCLSLQGDPDWRFEALAQRIFRPLLAAHLAPSASQEAP